MTSRIFRGGVPTGPDVQILIDAFDANPGDEISHVDVAIAIGVTVQSSRFLTVTTAWRKRLFRDRRLQVKSEGGVFRVLTPDECVSAAAESMNRIGRATGRTVVRIESVDQTGLSQAAQAQHTLLRRHSLALLESAQAACEGIAAPKPIEISSVRIANSEGSAQSND